MSQFIMIDRNYRVKMYYSPENLVTCNSVKIRTPLQVFFYEHYKIFQSSFFTGRLQKIELSISLFKLFQTTTQKY